MATNIYSGSSSLNVKSNGGNTIYNTRLVVDLNSVDSETKKANVTIKMYWSASPVYFANYSYAFNYADYVVFITLYDSVSGVSRQVGRRINTTCYKYETLATSWTGDIDYSDDGTLSIKATCGCATTTIAYLPSSSSVATITTGNLFLPQLDLEPKFFVQVNGTKKKTIKSLIQVNGTPKRVKKMFIQVNGSVKQIK